MSRGFQTYPYAFGSKGNVIWAAEENSIEVEVISATVLLQRQYSVSERWVLNVLVAM